MSPCTKKTSANLHEQIQCCNASQRTEAQSKPGFSSQQSFVVCPANNQLPVPVAVWCMVAGQLLLRCFVALKAC